MEKAVILIVDDEPTNISVLSQLLKETYRVRACKSGEQAPAALDMVPRPDLVLLDVMMPGMDGYAVLDRIRANPKNRDIPVIFVTALNDDLDEEKGLRLGAADYITKPIRPGIVLARVRTHLEIKRARDRLAEQNVWLEAEVVRRTSENDLIRDVSLRVLSELAETRHKDAGDHIARTQSYIEAVARRLRMGSAFQAELNEPNLERIVRASPLHDIGKVGIPDSILLKPGPLAPDEWAIMKTHCRIGADAIARAIGSARRERPDRATGSTPEALSFLEMARIIALSHHERWDGTGYPDGLAGDAIPLPARLMAVADVFDALTSPRVYKAPWSFDAAAEYIVRNSGTHFDPDIVAAFDAERGTFGDICRRATDAREEESA